MELESFAKDKTSHSHGTVWEMLFWYAGSYDFALWVQLRYLRILQERRAAEAAQPSVAHCLRMPAHAENAVSAASLLR